MTLSKKERARKDLAGLRQRAVERGERYSVRSQIGPTLYPPSFFCRTLLDATAERDRVFERTNNAEGGDIHARSDDVMKLEVFVERYREGEWTVVEDSRLYGEYDSSRRRRS